MIYNAILDVLCGEITWRMLPSSFPPWPTVYSLFRRRADAGKKVTVRKRHLVVDSEGFLVAATVSPVNVQDPLAAPELLARLWAT